jgi:aspartate aminotransferase
VIDEGDEVIIPAPYWVTYPELTRLNGGVVIEPKTDESTGFKLTAEVLKTLITPKTKMIVLTSPSNPTGSVYSKEELTAIAEVLKGTNIIVASDEMYEKLLYDGKTFTSAAAISEDMYARTVTINGLSKSVAMTGWRFGYLASPDKILIKAMNNLQSQSTSNINSITQKAAIIGLNGSVDSEVEAMRVEFEKRRNLAAEGFNDIDGLSVLKPDGAFYLFVNCSKVEKDSMKFCRKLLEAEGVAVVPGSGFGVDGYFRFSFATDESTIQNGIERIKRFVKNR